ncbi:hypothetical protein AZE42_06286 [Rhizopogon vesiculosus]|uniref:Uncharacterized protein n=1 Tax=Rhizopogon vesiculosus TaxID=180088 RepID=A0A1J8R4P9_9AGAM|nr:hypothetical protein AZE42_06286 [Rhizopogon vesiculosus]
MKIPLQPPYPSHIDEQCILYRLVDTDHLHFALFLNLTTLIFHVEMFRDVVTVMEHSRFPSLKQFKIYVTILPWADAMRLFRALSLCKACDTLENIQIDSCSEDLSPKPLTVVRQFLCFRQLLTLRQIAPSTLTITSFWKPCQVGPTSTIYA